MDYQRLRFSLDERTARITLAHAQEGNRIDQRLLRELDDAAARIAEDAAVNVAVIDAEGDDFCLGWDDATRAELLATTQAVVDPFGAIAGLACPTVASIRGGAVSGGLELALACDIRIAEEGVRFGVPEVSQGMMPLAGATQRLPRVAGKAAALSILLLGEEFNGKRAYECGLVSRLVAQGQLEAETNAVAEAIAARGPLAVRYAKEAAVRGVEMTLDQGLRFETDLSIILQTTEDRAEGLRAFFEKRPPNFKGR